MKTFAIQIMTVLIFLLIACFSCSKDENAVNESVLCNTFLECNATTKWKQVFFEDGIESAHIYLRINNDLNNPFENWLNVSPNSCYISMQISDHQFEILKNSKDKLIVK